MNFENPGFGVAILAGGRGRRLGGVAKGNLTINGRSFLHRQLHLVKPLNCPIALITKSIHTYPDFPHSVYIDQHQGQAPILGIHTALCEMPVDYVVILAVDMQGMSTAFLRYLLSFRERADVVIPRWGQNLEPLCAVYGKPVMPVLKQMVDQKRYRPVEMLAKVKTIYIEEQQIQQFDDPSRLFFNVNTPEDLEKHPAID